MDITALEMMAGQHQFSSLFRVVLTDDPQSAERIDRLSFGDGLPFLHVSSVNSAGRISADQLTVQTLADFIEQVLLEVSKRPSWVNFVQAARESIGVGAIKKMGAVPFGSSCHNVTTPGEFALRSFGYRFDSEEPIVDKEAGNLPTDSARYIDHICRLADFMTSEKRRLTESLPPDLRDWSYIVTVPSLHWSHYRGWQSRGDKLAGADKAAFKAAYKAAVTQDTYFDRFEGDRVQRYIENKLFRAVIASRVADQRCYTAGLALLACSTLTPVLRIEPKINRLRGEIKILSHGVRSSGKRNRQWKQSRLARKLSERIRDSVDNRFLQRLDSWSKQLPIEGLKIVADMPIEWLSAGGIPLGLRYDTSRLTVLPGNSFIAECAAPPSVVPESAFQNILVVRSFEEGDPLKPMLKQAVDLLMERHTTECSVKFVDVSSESEFVSAVNEANSPVLVFDGHGGYEDRYGVGTIIVGGKPLDIWLLREKCHLPPILIFSACDTHPIDGSHGSCANAGLVLGAKAVLGTMLPIDGKLAALFIGRLLFRIFEFIPAALRDRPILTWREVISGMLRMAYTSEVTGLLIKYAGLSLTAEARSRVQLAANIGINNRRSDWYELYLGELAKESGKNVNEIGSLARLWASMTDSQKYVQLGAPENVVIERDAN